MLDAFSPNFSLDGLGLELGSVGRCDPTRANPSPPQWLFLSRFPRTPIVANVDDEPSLARLRVFTSFELSLTSILSRLAFRADLQSTGAST